MKKKLIVPVLFAMLFMAGCGNTKDNKDTAEKTPTPTVTETITPTETPTPTDTPAPTPTPEVDWYGDMVKKSLITTGNNARLKAVIEKARSGETVYLAAIGGSVTEGAGAGNFGNGYAYQFMKAFGETYGTDGGSNVKYVCAGLGGTPSSLGALRYERDVVNTLGANPDLLIIEFAVNDADDVTGARAYESMLNQAMTDNPDAAVILLFSVFKSKWNLQTTYMPIGNYYNLPMVSIKNAVEKPYKEGHLTDKLFFADEYHPTLYGHGIMKDCLMNLLSVVDAQEADPKGVVPQVGKKGLDFLHVKMITSADSPGAVIDTGSFTQTDTAIHPYFWTGKGAFPENWKHDASAGNKAYTMKLTCRNLMLCYKKANSSQFGDAQVYVDGELVKTIAGNPQGAWNNCDTILIIDEKEAAEHTVEVRMAEGQEDKAFTIYAWGYTK